MEGPPADVLSGFSKETARDLRILAIEDLIKTA